MNSREILDEWLIQVDSNDFKEGHYMVIENAMKEFAKQKCKELLEIVAEKAELNNTYYCSIRGGHITEEAGKEYQTEWEVVSVNKDSILNAIDLDEFIG